MVTAAQRLRAWQRANPGRHVYFGRRLVALGDGERSLFATGATTEAAARAVLALWYSTHEQAA